MKPAYILSLLLPLAFSATGQDLTKEITIDRDIVPQQRAASRPVVFPSVATPQLSKTSLKMVDNAETVALTPTIGFYDPAQAEPCFPETPWRGYLDAGYFPTADFGVSAGYAFIANSSTTLNAWTQINNNSYKEFSDDDFRFKTFDGTIGVNLSHKFSKFNRLKISTDVGFSSWSNPELYIEKWRINTFTPGEAGDNSKNLRWNLNASFDGRINSDIAYGFSLSGGIFNNLNSAGDEDYIGGSTSSSAVKAASPLVKESTIGFGACLKGQVTEKASLGISADGKFLHYNSFLTPSQFISERALPNEADAKTIGIVNILPAAEFNGGGFYGRLGARFGLSVNSGKNFHIAPDVLFGVNPDDRFGAWLKFSGGVQTNDLAELYMISRYADQRVAYNLSNIPVTGQFGLRVGPFRGATLTFTLDYAAANNWLMPLQYTYEYTSGENHQATAAISRGANLFAPTDLRSWKVGARFDWSFRRIFDIALSFDATLGNGERHSWLYWRDRARQVAGVELTLHPGEFAEAVEVLKPLSIDLGFTARLDRKQYYLNFSPIYYINDQDYIQNADNYAAPDYSAAESYNIGDLVNLSAGASWRFSPRFTIFARFNNLLNRHDNGIFNTPAPGLTGLFGITYKF